MKIELLFPDACNLYGDNMNAEYLARSAGAELIKTPLRSKPEFLSGGVSLVYLGTMTEESQALVAEALMPYRDDIIRLIDEGQVFLITGNALEIFGKYIEDEDGGRIPCLGLFNTYARREMLGRYNSLYLGNFDGNEIVGFKSIFSHSWGDNSDCWLFDTVRGDGINTDTKKEGFRRNNFLATYVTGPITVMNPHFARYMLRLIGAPDASPLYEEAAMTAYEKRLSELHDEKLKFRYS